MNPPWWCSFWSRESIASLCAVLTAGGCDRAAWAPDMEHACYNISSGDLPATSCIVSEFVDLTATRFAQISFHKTAHLDDIL
jgi:hypothetical protein